MNVSMSKRRAISTVVTTAMMLVAVAMIGTGVVAWSNSNLRSYENILVTSASNKTNTINEIPLIENVILDPNPSGVKLVNVTVTNSGSAGFTVKTITLTDPTQNVVNSVSSGGGISAHTSKLFSYPFNWQNTYFTTVQVTTTRGTTISTQVLP